jgi:hypothetical protein
MSKKIICTCESTYKHYEAYWKTVDFSKIHSRVTENQIDTLFVYFINLIL